MYSAWLGAWLTNAGSIMGARWPNINTTLTPRDRAKQRAFSHTHTKGFELTISGLTLRNASANRGGFPFLCTRSDFFGEFWKWPIPGLRP